MLKVPMKHIKTIILVSCTVLVQTKKCGLHTGTVHVIFSIKADKRKRNKNQLTLLYSVHCTLYSVHCTVGWVDIGTST
jgi:hypothetical protein